MLHVCVERFDVMGGRGNILGWDGEVNKAILALIQPNQSERDKRSYYGCGSKGLFGD
jgi:hypothetical protein